MASSGFGKVAGYQMLLLKDYLRDDLSSCSSSGFKSLPRRQCCPQPPFSSSTKSALHKASESLVNVFKSLTIIRSQSLSRAQKCKVKKGGGGGSVLSRNLSLKLLSRSFWKIRQSSSKQGGSNINNNEWTASHFNHSLTSAKELTTTSNYTFSTTTDSTRPNEEREQFSPVSVLECPLLFDDDEDITSPFSSTTCSNVEGTKHNKHVKKGQHFNRVASVKPIALEKRMLSWSIIHEDESLDNYNNSTKHCPSLLGPIMCKSSNIASDDDKVEENAGDLLNHVKRSIPSNSLMRTEAEKLLFDFFKQGIMNNNNNNDIENSMKHEYLCKVAENWIRGQPHHQEQNSRQCLSWRICDEEIQNLIMELEVDFSSSLVNELVHDLIT